MSAAALLLAAAALLTPLTTRTENVRRQWRATRSLECRVDGVAFHQTKSEDLGLAPEDFEDDE